MATGLLPLATQFIKSQLVPSVDANTTPFYASNAAPVAQDQGWYQMQPGTTQVPQQQSGLLGGIGDFFGDKENMAKLALGLNAMTLRPSEGIQQLALNTLKTAQTERATAKQKNQSIEALRAAGVDESQIELLAQNPELLKVAVTELYKSKYSGSKTPAELQTFEAMTAGLTDKQKARAREIYLGLSPRAAQSLSIPLDRYMQQAYMTGAGQAASTAEAKTIQQAESNSRLRVMINDSLDTLGAALGATGQSGKLFGNIPAVTTAAQIADNAKALVLPTMKSIFRGAGEGVFTDKDQEALEQMMPTRDMTADAAKQALVNVKRLIEFKLQDPNFDISAYGSALSGRNKMPAPTPSPVPAPIQPKSDVRSAADAIISGVR